MNAPHRPGKPICYVNYSPHSIISSAVATHRIVNNTHTQRPKYCSNPVEWWTGTKERAMFLMWMFSYSYFSGFRHLRTSRWSFIAALNIALISFVLFDIFKSRKIIWDFIVLQRLVTWSVILLPNVQYQEISPGCALLSLCQSSH